MEKAREDVARTGLDALKGYGFALAGASASELHGLISRPTRDLDLFNNLLDKGRFGQALQDLSAAYRSEGSSVRTVQQSDVFARLEITTPAGAVVPVDIAVDWRAYQPAQFNVGPVLDERDAAASKIDALMSRSLPRDFLDVDSIRNDGRFTEDKLLELTAYRFGSSFDRAELGYALRQVMRVRPEDVAEYGVGPRALDQIKLRLVEWAETVSPPRPGEIDITAARAVIDANLPGPGAVRPAPTGPAAGTRPYAPARVNGPGYSR
jgi:hypothetical protein